jgi:hypothetical protein
VGTRFPGEPERVGVAREEGPGGIERDVARVGSLEVVYARVLQGRDRIFVAGHPAPADRSPERVLLVAEANPPVRAARDGAPGELAPERLPEIEVSPDARDHEAGRRTVRPNSWNGGRRTRRARFDPDAASRPSGRSRSALDVGDMAAPDRKPGRAGHLRRPRIVVFSGPSTQVRIRLAVRRAPILLE